MGVWVFGNSSSVKRPASGVLRFRLPQRDVVQQGEEEGEGVS